MLTTFSAHARSRSCRALLALFALLQGVPLLGWVAKSRAQDFPSPGALKASPTPPAPTVTDETTLPKIPTDTGALSVPAIDSSAPQSSSVDSGSSSPGGQASLPLQPQLNATVNADRSSSTKRFTSDRPRELWSEERQDAFHGADDDADRVSVIDFIDSEVVSASNQAESSLTAPAWIISLSAQDLRDRGYVELTELLDDLPSMDIIRPFGAPYFKNYWRGYRNSIGAPYLLMIDGVILNSLFANDTTIFGAIPLSSIEHVEVVYGPASAVYGPNAAMGVINVITNRAADEKGLHTEMRATIGAPGNLAFPNQTKIADSSVRYNGDGYRVLGSVRFEFGVLDPGIGENFEWTKEAYYRSEHWGRYGRLPGIGEGFRSPDEKEGGSLRLIFGRHGACGDREVKTGRGQCTEVAVEHYEQTTGKGTLYPAPMAQTRPTTTFFEEGAHIRHIRDLSSSLTSDTRIRFRTSATDKGSQELFYDGDTSGRLIGGARVGAEGNAWILTQDFNFNVGKNLILANDVLAFKLGVRYSRISLDHDLIYSDTFAKLYLPDAEPVDITSELEAVLAPEAVDSRSNLDTGGAYLLGFYSIAQTHYLNAGVRLDYSQSHGAVEPTLRAGYVGRLTSNLTIKALFGQAFQEPTVGELLGAAEEDERAPMEPGAPMDACRRDCENSELRSERSQTIELSANYTTDYTAFRVGGFYVSYHDAMVLDGANTVKNAETRNVIGADISARALLPLWDKARLNIWAYYSMLALAEQTDVNDDSALVPVGDLAQHKVLGGVTLRASETAAFTLLARFIGNRDTVSTNPLNVNAYLTLDANIVVDDIFVPGLSLGLRATNLLDTVYFHPGLQDASSGQDPESFTADFAWTGGPHNSLLPQPGREVFATLTLAL